MLYDPAIAPESNKKVIGRAWNLYSYSFSKIFLLSFCLSLISFIPWLIDLAQGDRVVDVTPLFSWYRFWYFIIDLACLIFFICILWRLRCFLLGKRERLEEDFKIAIKKFPLILLASIIQSLLFFILQIFLLSYYSYLAKNGILTSFNFQSVAIVLIPSFIIVGFVVYVYGLFSFYTPLIVTENSSIIGSLKQSASLVWGNWWRVVAVQLFPWFCYLITIMLFKAIFGLKIHTVFAEAGPLDLSGLYTHILLFAIFVPWYAATLIVQLHDLELRKIANDAIKPH